MHYDAQEINKFNNLSHEWWDIDGKFKTLHHINPLRLQFIQKHIELSGKNVIDVGCGGGILSESLAHCKANVTAIDLAEQAIEVAKLHLYESGLNIDYQCINVEAVASNMPESFDIVSCMEMLEHVIDPEIIIANCAKLLKPGGYAFFSTINRTLKSYALGVIAAEYILQLLPKGTHSYEKFIRPAEFYKILSKYNLTLVDIKGIQYNPLNSSASISNNVDINYMVCCIKS
ncbi:MAG: bifunctional 2-polyprenyl-6-hydroxyphenol methylase/3-demethylubiquinol 3-O-methyltransferase UbiG [Neisseriaceae bacterium]|jgi:2-polyprenyl-6-hydroxyphenyl methylase/3-demethylubiquinone-9 3-methyltransferase